jgi:hypothetical protein
MRATLLMSDIHYVRRQDIHSDIGSVPECRRRPHPAPLPGGLAPSKRTDGDRGAYTQH